MFKIGEKVVCVNPIDELVKNEIYTIKLIDEAIDGTCVLLEEVDNGSKYSFMGYTFYGYNPNRFRKLDYEFADNLLAEISEAMKSETILN